jgi:hypothetical protein
VLACDIFFSFVLAHIDSNATDFFILVYAEIRMVLLAVI